MSSIPLGEGQPAQSSPQPTCGAWVSVLTWNVQHASAARSHRQAAWLAGQPNSDVVVLTEVSPGPGGIAMAGALVDLGYSVLAPAAAQRDTYGTILATRRGAHREVHPGIDVFPHRSVATIIQVDAFSLMVVGLYVPSRGPRQSRNVAKRAFQRAAAAALPRLAQMTGPVLVTGDMNVVEPGHCPHYRVFGAWEYNFYRQFAAAGFIDTYRALHPSGSDHSWYGRGGNGYRFDHTFLSLTDQPRLRSSTYDHGPRLAGLSDHSVMITTLLI